MVKHIQLSNGIKVVMEHLTQYRTVTFGTWVKAGSINETKEDSGIAHMLEHMFFKGTYHNTSKELADRTAYIGDDLNAFTSKEFTSFYGTTTSEQIHELIRLIGEMLFESRFDEADIKKEKKIILDEIDMYEDSPDDIVHDLIQKTVWKGHSLGNVIAGTKRSVRSFTKDRMLSFKERFYVPSRIVISIAGNYQETDIINQLEEIFGKLSEPVDSKQYNEEPPSYIKSFCYQYKDIEQIHCNMVFPSLPAGMPKRYAFAILNSIFGGSNTSRLFQTIREERGMAYSVYSYASEFAAAGLFHIDVTVNPQRILQVLEMTLLLLTKLQEEGITEQELRIHKAQLSTELVMGSESTKAKMNSNAKSIFLRNAVLSLDEKLEEINKVERDDIMRLVHEYLQPDKLSICVIGAKDAMDPAEIRRFWKQAGGNRPAC